MAPQVIQLQPQQMTNQAAPPPGEYRLTPTDDQSGGPPPPPWGNTGTPQHMYDQSGGTTPWGNTGTPQQMTIQVAPPPGGIQFHLR